MKLTVTLQQHQLKNKAMAQAGISSRAIALKPGNRVHTNRRHAVALGRTKHKGHSDY